MHPKRRNADFAFRSLALASLVHSIHASAATESIEFVSEHLAEIAMDNRYATLPLWSMPAAKWSMTTQAAYAQTRTGGLSIDGPMFALGVSHRLGENWQITGLAFFDDLILAGDIDRRPLEVQFTSGVPLTLPAEAEFTGLSGTGRSTGAGFALRRSGEMR